MQQGVIVPDIPLVASSTAANAGAGNTLVFPTTAIGRNSYISSITIGGGGATAGTPVNVTLSNIILQGSTTGTMNLGYSYAVGATIDSTRQYVFNPAVAVANGQTTTMTVPGAAGNTNQSLTITGFSV